MSAFSTPAPVLPISTLSTSASTPRPAADRQLSLSAKLANWSSSLVDGDALKASLTAWVNSEEEFESFSDTSSEGESGSDSSSDAETVVSSIFDSPPPSPRLVDSLLLPSSSTLLSTSTSSFTTFTSTNSTSTTPISTLAPLSKRKFTFDWSDELTTPSSYFDSLPVFDEVATPTLPSTTSSTPVPVLAPVVVTPTPVIVASTSRKFDFDWASEEDTPASYFDIAPFQEAIIPLVEVKTVISLPTPTIVTPALTKKFDFGFDWSSEHATPESFFLDLPTFDETVVTPLPAPTPETTRITSVPAVVVEERKSTFGSWAESSSTGEAEEDDDDYFAILPTWDNTPSTPILAKATLPTPTPTPITPLLNIISLDPVEYSSNFIHLPALRKPLKSRPFNSGVSEHPQSLLRSAIGYSAWMKGLACYRI